MRKLLPLLLAPALAVTVFAQLPAYYKSVSRVVWVVKDLKPVVSGWQKLDAAVEDRGTIEHQATFRGKPVTVKLRAAAARVGDLEVSWIQPAGGANAYTEFLAKHGDGVFSLAHRVPSLEDLELEVGRLSGLGAGVLQRGTVETEGGSVTYVQFDTEPKGKYSLGLVYEPPGVKSGLPETTGPKVTQYAFVVRNMRAVSAWWEKLGFPAMSYTHPPLSELVYRGKPGSFDQELGWQRHGQVVYEWIQPIKGPTVYNDFLQAHGEGLHHIAFDAPDLDKETARWTSAGYRVAQSGAWGEKDKPGSGRFAYVDTDAAGGVTVELLWNHKP
jgi:catechol 2,3-dioxygenase-like lactoylglutathione lyase family enzyme